MNALALSDLKSRGLVVWLEPNGDLYTLCRACANGRHGDHAADGCMCDLEAAS